MENAFIEEALNANAMTENGAVSYATTGKALTDQFGKAGTARGRDYETVWSEQAILWNENAENALRFPFYLRMITRKDNLLDGTSTETVQRGQGVRDEAFKRLLWIAAFHSDEFYRNLWVLPVIGSWKDLWVIASMAINDVDEMPNKVELDFEKIFDVIAQGLHSESHVDLVKKYMPRIRSNEKCKTKWAVSTNKLAKMFCDYVGWTPKEYRKFKSNGRAHEFQRVICSGNYDVINWNTIPGKALLSLVAGNFLGNHGLEESYTKWLDAQPAVKFNGYAFELAAKLRGNGIPLSTTITVNKQFESLIKAGKSDGGAIQGNVLCALDTSASMGCRVQGAGNVTALDVCVGLGIYFSELNEGAFHNVVAMFDNTSRLKALSGTFSEKLSQVPRNAMGGTNFQSLIDLIVNTRKKNKNIPLEDFPKTLLVVSDMQFNPSSTMYGWGDYTSEEEQTNYKAAMRKLSTVFPKEFVDDFKIVWWYCTGRETSDYASTINDKGTYVVSGFDGSVISLLLGGDDNVDPETGAKVQLSMEELAQKALNQEALMLVA